MTNSVMRAKKWDKLRKIVKDNEKTDNLLSIGFIQLIKMSLELNDRLEDLEIKSEVNDRY